MKQIFASNNKEKISEVFNFPITEKKIGLYIDNENFNKELEKNKNQISRKMFINYFDDIHKSSWINQINDLFQTLKLDKLEQKDNLNHDAIINSEPCFYFYEIIIENKEVKLIVGSKSNANYKNKLNDDETLENDSSNCESTIWWTFELIGEKLQLKEISGAG